jgi:tryptophan synthase beta chain
MINQATPATLSTQVNHPAKAGSPVAVDNCLQTARERDGHAGACGKYPVIETLMPRLLELENAYRAAQNDVTFANQFDALMMHYVGRPSPLYHAARLTDALRARLPSGKGPKVYFKREELNHTGAHKINNCIGQIMLAKRMGKTRVIAETSTGQHGVATATAAARLAVPCTIFMGARDIARQKANVFRMELLGAEIVPITSGEQGLEDAMNAARQDWVANIDQAFYVIGTATGPHPYPEMVRDFQSIIGIEARAQILAAEGRLPDLLVAAVGGGSNALGLFHPFRGDRNITMLATEASDPGTVPDQHAANPGEGNLVLRESNHADSPKDTAGLSSEVSAIPARHDDPAVGPDHNGLHDIERVRYMGVTDADALAAFQLCCHREGIIPSLECARAIAGLAHIAGDYGIDQLAILTLSGRGEKDVFTVARALGEPI